VRAEISDVAYVLGITNQFFPNANLVPQDVVSIWAGLRPLVADPNGKPSDISRSHEIRNPEPGWWDVAGGKLTTYRLMAEQTVDQIVKALRASNAVNGGLARCRTAHEPLLPEDQISGSGILPPDCTRQAVEHYCAQEWAVHLDDVMVRRSSWHYYFPDASRIAERVADWMAELLDWPEQTRRAELDLYRERTGLPFPAASEVKSRPVASLPA
jgi:glycerol-3-phosphate dehydrogenase